MMFNSLDRWSQTSAGQWLLGALVIEFIVIANAVWFYQSVQPTTSQMFLFLSVIALTLGIVQAAFAFGHARDLENERIRAQQKPETPGSPGSPPPEQDLDQSGGSEQGSSSSSSAPGAQNGTANPPSSGSQWKPSYAYLLAAAFFAMAVALHTTPARTITSPATSIALMPSPPPPTPSPTPSPTPPPGSSPAPLAAALPPKPTPEPTPMQCQATLSGPDSLTPGGAAAYDAQVLCPDRPATVPTIALETTWSEPTPLYGAATSDGKNFTWRAVVNVPPAPTATAGNDVHALVYSKITADPTQSAKPADQKAPVPNRESPLLPVTIKQDRTLDSIKGVITSAGGAISALLALIAGLFAFLKGEGPPPRPLQ
jgi:hypothetical protein